MSSNESKIGNEALHYLGDLLYTRTRGDPTSEDPGEVTFFATATPKGMVFLESEDGEPWGLSLQEQAWTRARRDKLFSPQATAADRSEWNKHEIHDNM